MRRSSPARRTHNWLLLAAGVLITPLLLVVQPVSAAAATAPSVVTTRTAAPVYLSDAASTLVSVASVRLAAGAWTISSDVTAINFGGGDFVRCQLQETGTLIDGGSTVFLANRVAGLTDVGTFSSTGAQIASILCEHDHAAATHDQFYVDPGATLTAVLGGPIKSPGSTSSSAPTVVEARNSAATTLSTSEQRRVTSIHLAAGSWAITANVTAVNFGQTNVTYCTLTDSSHQFGAADTGTDGTDAAAAGIDIDAVDTVLSGGASVTLYCTGGLAGDYIDAGATLTATKVAAAALVTTTTETTSLPPAGGTTKVVAKQSMPAGAWRVRADTTFADVTTVGIATPNRDFMRCTLNANGTPIDGGATVEMTPDSYLSAIVNAGSYTATARWTLTLVCSHDAQHTGVGHWAAVATLLAVKKGPISNL